MSIEFPTDTSEILEPESETGPTVIASTARNFWSIATDHSSSAAAKAEDTRTRKSGNGRPAKPADFAILFAIFIMLIAMVVFNFMGKV